MMMRIVDGNTEMRNPDLEIYFMRQALHVAEAALERGEVPVGCVIVLRDATDILKTEASSSQPQSNKSISTISCPYDTSPSVIISHGANQVNATRDATRHGELVAIDRMLNRGLSSDQMKLPPHIICKPSHGKANPAPAYSSSNTVNDDNDYWINVPQCKDHWKNSFGWGSSRIFDKEILKECDLYVTCEPCIMCAAALSMVGIKRVFFGCKNDRFGGCGSLLHLHRWDALPSSKHHGFKMIGGILESEAVTLLRGFYDRENFHAPDDLRRKKKSNNDETSIRESNRV